MKITLENSRKFAAAMFCMSTEQTRYYLNGVYIQAAEGGGYLLTSTDGHRLFHGYDQAAAPVPEGFKPVIIKPAKKTLAAAWFKGENPLEIDLETLTMRCGSEVMGVVDIDGTYPDYTRVFPSDEVSNEPAQYNPKYLLDFQKMSGVLDGGDIAIAHNGGNPAIVRFNYIQDAFGVLMPMRTPWFNPVKPAMPAAKY